MVSVGTSMVIISLGALVPQDGRNRLHSGPAKLVEHIIHKSLRLNNESFDHNNVIL